GGVEAGQDHVELGLLLSGGSGGASGGSGHGGGGHAELLLQSVDQLAELQNGQSLDLFDHSGNFLRHDMCLLIVKFRFCWDRRSLGGGSGFLSGSLGRGGLLGSSGGLAALLRDLL